MEPYEQVDTIQLRSVQQFIQLRGSKSGANWYIHYHTSSQEVERLRRSR